MKSEDELRNAGFTQSGAKRYAATAADYCGQLFTKSVALGDIDKAADTAREVTHDHVRTAAAVLAVRGNAGKPPHHIFCQVGEYVCAALAGVGGGKLDQTWGVSLFGLSLTIGVILFVIRNPRS